VILRQRFRQWLPWRSALSASSMREMRRNLIELTGTLRRREAEAQALLKGIVEVSCGRQRAADPLRQSADSCALGRTESEIIGHFCGDVSPAPGVDGVCARCEHACPILQARGRGAKFGAR